MTRIPMGADPADPRWEPAYLDLAHGLVMASAKPKLVVHLTQMPLRRVRELYQALLGKHAPAGPIASASPAFFVLPGSRTSTNWGIQSAAYLSCYDDIAEMSTIPLHRGWRMLEAYRFYLWSTQASMAQRRFKRLDINQAYALLMHCRFLESKDADIQRRRCPRCLLEFLVLKRETSIRQTCPVCGIDTHYEHLVAQGLGTRT